MIKEVKKVPEPTQITKEIAIKEIKKAATLNNTSDKKAV